MYGNLVVSPHKVNFGKVGAAGKVVGVVLYVCDWVDVRNVASVKGSVVSARPPNTVLLRYEMQGEDHGSSARRAVPSYRMANSALATAKRSGSRRRGRQVTGWPGVFRMW
jgi:hypothetical protein